MAASETPESSPIPVGSHDTALCIIPPKHLWPPIERLRALYDKAYERWPPHVNLIFAFVRFESLDRAVLRLQAAIRKWHESTSGGNSLKVRLDCAGVFPHKYDNTLYLHDSDEERTASLQQLRSLILASLGQENFEYHMHLTVAQSDDIKGDTHNFLLHKVSLLPAVDWEAGQLCILMRERVQVDGATRSQMKLWGAVSLADGTLSRPPRPVGFYEPSDETGDDSDEDAAAERDLLQTMPSYCYNDNTGLWEAYEREEEDGDRPATPEHFVVASYNVLAEFAWPVSRARYPLLAKNILAANAAADALVLQEVTDDFLSYLLHSERVRDAYPFVSHGPPCQADVEPLPSLLNIVVLSKWAFGWEWVSFKRKHKGSVVVRFEDVGVRDEDGLTPVILASVHLTCGLTDGSVSNKKVEVQRILNYLKKTYPSNPWVLAGDFNIPTSSFTIDAALKKKAISSLTATYISGFEEKFREFGFVDAWSTCRLEVGGDASDADELFEGEQGATFDPSVNDLAAKIVGSGFNNRPQRYDRILVKGEDFVRASRFNRFGLRAAKLLHGGEEDSAVEESFASDHWGVRCLLKLGTESLQRTADEISNLVVPVTLKAAPESLADASKLDSTLARLGVFPTEEEVAHRKEVVDLLKSILLENPAGTASDAAGLGRLQPSVVLVPCGSYALGVWTSTSDIDCLCIGPFSSKTFFALAAQRLRRAAAQGVRILRRVRAHTGTMLELDVRGVRADLQYCPAAALASRWPDALRLPPSHPAFFALPPQALAKLKAVRDADYIRRSVPDPPRFRTAHRFLRTWARSRGLYAARFGYLGGVQIAVLLARVCKMLARDGGAGAGAAPRPSVPDLLATFFAHYAAFDWRRRIAFDPLFHSRAGGERLPYARTAREPLAILGYFPPALNTAHAASVPSVRTLAEELRRADRLLAEDGMTWSRFLCGSDDDDDDIAAQQDPTAAAAAVALDTAGAKAFARAYRTYVRIDAQYWGISPSRGASFVGWLESRCVVLLVDMQRRLPALHARVWPARFVARADGSDETSSAAAGNDDAAGQQRDYQGCYLIGLDYQTDAEDNSNSSNDPKVAAGTLQTVLRRFEEQIRGDERYYDAKCQWMSASVVRRSELGDLDVDNRQWGEYTPGEEDSDDDDDDDDDNEATDELDQDLLDHETLPTRTKKTKKGNNKAADPRPEGAAATAATTGKLRSALDVLSRLRWDPNLDSGDYIVGYEDRFVGARERPLEQWKSEQTDEEFIPQHRVLYFKRRSDGAVVWERRTRKDELFGSGAAAPSAA